MRKTFLIAGVAAFALGTTGVAIAQTPAPEVTVSAKLSPSKAGTKAKPKSAKLKLAINNNKDSKTTAKQIKITLPKTVKLSTKGLDVCTASDDKLLEGPKKACPKAIVGKGTADAFVNPFADSPAPLHFTLTPLAGKNELIFVLDSPVADAVLRAKIKGSTLTINIPDFLQMPAPNTYSALEKIETTLSKKKGKHSLLSTVGCKGGKHTTKVTVAYAPNPNPPVAGSATGSGSSKCSK